jgi:translation initiation factor 4E
VSQGPVFDGTQLEKTDDRRASCDSGFSTDSDELSFSGDEASLSPVLSPVPKEEEKSLTCQENVPEFPLNRSWTWYYLSNTSKDWDERINKIAEVKTVNDFWKTYGHIKLPTHISVGCDLMFFQSDIEPKWENEENRTGGRLVIEIKKEHRNEMLIGNWLNTLLGLIGENCSVPQVAKCYGVQFQSRRKMDKLSLWVASGHSRNEIMNLGAWFKEGANKASINSGKVKYHLHASQAGKTTSSRRFEYCV